MEFDEFVSQVRRELARRQWSAYQLRMRSGVTGVYGWLNGTVKDARLSHMARVCAVFGWRLKVAQGCGEE